MKTVHAIWKNGKIELQDPVDWPDGCSLTIEPQIDRHFVGMTESEQCDDPESIAQWIAEFNAIPPMVMSPKDEAEMLAWRKVMHDYNVEAVRKQMELDAP